MNMKANPKIGQVVEVVFDDHSEGDCVPTFRVFGRVVAKDRKSIVVRTWEHETQEPNENDMTYTILRKVIKELWVIERKAAPDATAG